MFLDSFEKASAAENETRRTITVKKPKIKFDKNFDQTQFQQYALLRSDHIPETGFAVGAPDEFQWKYEPKFDLKFSDQIKSNWPEWFKGEQEEWAYNHGPVEKADHFQKWSKDPERKPIIVVEGLDGKWHIWDGHHRVGMAHVLKLKSIPALVGKRGKK